MSARILDGRAVAADIRAEITRRVAEQARWLASMPGGAGPVTRAMLLVNVVGAAEATAGAAEGPTHE